jgi:hypothetical protein
MASEEQLQSIANAYKESGEEWPATKTQIARWAVATGRWRPQPEHLIAQCAEELGQAMALEHYTDAQGRSIRAKHAARMKHGGQTLWVWDDHRTMTRQHAAISFSLRRAQMFGEVKQLKNDVDSFNDNRTPRRPIQMSFNFANDLRDEEAATALGAVASSSVRGRRSVRPRHAAQRSSARPEPSLP